MDLNSLFGERYEDLFRGTFYENDVKDKPRFPKIIVKKSFKWTDEQKKNFAAYIVKCGSAKRSGQTRSKSYTLRNKRGQLIHFRNLIQYSKRNRLCLRMMQRVLAGEIRQYKGYHLP